MTCGVGDGDERGLICILNHQLYSNSDYLEECEEVFPVQNALYNQRKKKMTQLQANYISLINVCFFSDLPTSLPLLARCRLSSVTAK